MPLLLLKNIRKRKSMKRYERYAIVGQTQTGKTELVKRYMLPRIQKKFVIYDPDFEFSKFGMIRNTVDEIDFHCDDRIIFQPSDEALEDVPTRISQFNALVKELNGLCGWVLIIDELSNVTKPEDRVRAKCPGQLFIYVRRRMKKPYRNGFIFTTNRLSDADANIFGQCQHIFTFNSVKIDVDYITERIGVNIWDKVLKLRKYEYVYYNQVTKRKVSPCKVN